LPSRKQRWFGDDIEERRNDMKIMNLRFIPLLVALMCLPVLAAAGFKGGSGKGSVTTVQEFKNQCSLSSSGGGLSGLIDKGVKAAKCDDMKFIMEGNIVEQLGNNIFQFKDETGTINVEIDDFGGIDVTPENRVRLVGEADYDEGGLGLDVDRLELIK
jgi:uncharacterized protein (TIGR00156 family)